MILLLCVATLFSCQKNQPEKVNRAFYYWKSGWDYRLDDAEDSIVRTQKIKKLYIKFFEVSHNETVGNIPIAKTSLHFYRWRESGPLLIDSAAIIPTVFIDNEVFHKSTRAEIDTLAHNVNFLIGKYCDEKFQKKIPSELQMDCDWTEKTKDNYFYFLERLKAVSKKQISCTLRLYPYKYPDRMGVPPVDKAMLMCYNLIGPLQDKSRNSILDNDELKAYLDAKRYPLHLDVALPVFSWMHVFHNDHFKSIIYPDRKTIRSILKPTGDMWYEVMKDTVIDNVYLRLGDRVKYEEITADKVNKAIALIKKHVDLDNEITISLFHLDKGQLTNYTHEEIDRFYADFSE